MLELLEPKLDAFLALTSSGPAFVAVVAEAMADGAGGGAVQRSGSALTHRTWRVLLLCCRTDSCTGSAQDMVSSPGGTTIAGLRRLEQAGLRSA